MQSDLRVGQLPSEDEARSWMMGVNVSRMGREFPRVSRKDYHVLIGSEMPEDRNDDVFFTMLARVFKPYTEEWKDFVGVRAGRRDELPDGTGRYTVGRVVPPRYVPSWEYRAKSRAEQKDPDLKQYSLAMVLSDAYVRAKFDIGMSLINSVKELALTSPVDAAATLQEYMQSKVPEKKIRVVVGSYADGLAGCRSAIQSMARRFQTQVHTRAELIGDRFYVHAGDNDGSGNWCAVGPVKYAETVKDLFVLATNIGRHAAVHLFATETAKLRLDILIDGDVVAPDILGHARDMSDLRYQQDSGVVAGLNPVQSERFSRLSGNVLPVNDSGVHCSTAIQLQGEVALVNRHVDDESTELTLRGKPLGAKVPVGDDLWAVRSTGSCEPWRIRAAVPGELASIMYYNGHGVSLSAVFRVSSTDGYWLLSDLVEGVYPGMSGGAVVAMSDMALLGVHCGELRSKLKAAVVTDTLVADSYDFVTETSDNRYVGNVTSDAMTELMVKRGLGPIVTSLVGAMSVVESPVGGAVSTGLDVVDRGVVAVCGVGSRVVVKDHVREVVDFGACSGGLLSSGGICSGPPAYKTRHPLLGETAVLIAMDQEGPVVTGQLKVSHVGPQGRNLQLEGFTDGESVLVTGACVVSLQDGAVFGVVVRVVGSIVFSVQVPVAETAFEVSVEVEKIFPRLSVSAWESSKLTRVFEIGSELGGRMATYGLSALRYRLVRYLSNKSNVAEEAWESVVERAVSEDKLALICTRFGLHRCADVGSDEVRDLTSVEAATLMLGFIGLVDSFETDETVETWLESVGLLQVEKVRPVVERRESGFNVLSAQGEVLRPADSFSSP